MDRYTGFKSSPYTEGALFYGEKSAGKVSGMEEPLPEPQPEPAAAPAGAPGAT
jgi:hypothetical protein